jgi:hypothetical protein
MQFLKAPIPNRALLMLRVARTLSTAQSCVGGKLSPAWFKKAGSPICRTLPAPIVLIVHGQWVLNVLAHAQPIASFKSLSAWIASMSPRNSSRWFRLLTFFQPRPSATREASLARQVRRSVLRGEGFVNSPKFGEWIDPAADLLRLVNVISLAQFIPSFLRGMTADRFRSIEFSQTAYAQATDLLA